MTPRGGVAVGEHTTIKFLCPWSGSVPGRAEGELRGLGSERCVEPGAMTQTASKHCRRGIREGMDSRRREEKEEKTPQPECLAQGRVCGRQEVADWQTRELHPAKWTDALARGG